MTGRWEYLGWQSVAKLAWFKSGLQLRGGWGRRPKGNAPRSEASALGARWLLPARSQPPNSRHLRGWPRESSRPTPHAPRPTPHAPRPTPHAPRPNYVGGQPRFPAQKGGDPAASGDLRLGHRAPGRGGRRASIPLHALTTLLSALGAFCLWEFRVFSTNLNLLRSICSDHGDPARCAAATAAPDGSPR